MKELKHISGRFERGEYYWASEMRWTSRIRVLWGPSMSYIFMLHTKLKERNVLYRPSNPSYPYLRIVMPKQQDHTPRYLPHPNPTPHFLFPLLILLSTLSRQAPPIENPILYQSKKVDGIHRSRCYYPAWHTSNRTVSHNFSRLENTRREWVFIHTAGSRLHRSQPRLRLKGGSINILEIKRDEKGILRTWSDIAMIYLLYYTEKPGGRKGERKKTRIFIAGRSNISNPQPNLDLPVEEWKGVSNEKKR